MNEGSEESQQLRATRRLIWLYCILWLTEGLLRKWVVPQLSSALLLVRDPLVVLIYLQAMRARIFPSNLWMISFWVISAILGFQSLIHLYQAQVPAAAIVFGFRTFVLHIPLIWVVAAAFGRREIELMGKWVLYLAPILAFVMVVQFQVGPDHWLNAATLKGGSQIGSGMGKIRPASIFSFITGPIHFFTLATVFVLVGTLKKGVFPRWLLITGVASILVGASVSGSRGFFINCVVVTVFGAVAASRSAKNLGAIIGILVAAAVVFVYLGRFEVFQTGQAIFADRWTSEDEFGGSGGKSMFERYLNSFRVASLWAGRVPALGLGIGATSNLAVDITGQEALVEGEWERVIYEVGPIIAFLYLAFRAAVSIALLKSGFWTFRKGSPVCLLLASACFLDILNGNVRQVTTCGYISVICGLCFAASKAYGKESSISEADDTLVADVPQPVVLERPRQRGRGPHAVGGNPVHS